MTKEELIQAIRHHDKCYWQDNKPEISDAEYDKLVRELEKLDPFHELIRRVNALKCASVGKVKHNPPMLSLDKAYALDKVLDWAKSVARSEREMFSIQPKYDGIAGLIERASNKEINLSTRGDGYVGENITDKAPLITFEITEDHVGADRILGELLITKPHFDKVFSKIKRNNGLPYKNPRNAVAGVVGSKDISLFKQQGVTMTFVDYDMHETIVSLPNLKDLWTGILHKFAALPYPQDGVVIKLRDQEYADSLGATSHHPRGAIAYKFQNEQAESTLLAIEWSFGKNKLTPVAIFEPVELGGVTITRASLHNFNNVVSNDIKIGDAIVVERAGDVIPYISSSTPGEHRVDGVITNCPSCGSTLVVDDPELVCPNANCHEKVIQNILASIRHLGIDYLGEETLRKLMNTCKVQTLDGVLALTKADIRKLEAFDEKSTDRLYNEIQKAKSAEDYQLLAAMNLRGIGERLSREIFKHVNWHQLKTLTADQLTEKIPGIGEERAALLVAAADQFPDIDNELHAEPQSDKIVCFTGAMPMPRSYYRQIAVTRGYQVADAVTKECTLVVAEDPAGNSSKLKKAKQYGIRIISVTEFMNEQMTK